MRRCLNLVVFLSILLPRRCVLLIALLTVGIMGITSCDADNPTAPTGLVSSVVAEGTFTLAAFSPFDVQCEAVAFVPFTTTASGTLDVTADWSSSTNDVDIAIVRGGCSCEQPDCDEVAKTDSAAAKPEKLTVSNLVAGRYTFLSVNWGPGRESGTYRIVLTQ